MTTYADTLGALLLGGLLAVFLSGIVSMQAFVYIRLYPGDRRRIRATVCAVWLIDIVHTVMICVANWMYLIPHFGSNTTSETILWPISVTIALTAVATFLVHCFFAHRVYILSKQNWFIAAPLGALAVLRVISAMSCTAQMVHAGTWQGFRHNSAWLFTTGLSISAVLDLFIAVALIFYLQKSRSGWKAMDQIIGTIVLYTIENGLLTSVVAVLSLICWVTMKGNLIFLALHFAISKLYAISFLATLNARKTLQQRSKKSSHDYQLPVIFPTGNFGRSRLSTVPGTDPIGSAVQISVQKTIHCVTDIGDEIPPRSSDDERKTRVEPP